MGTLAFNNLISFGALQKFLPSKRKLSRLRAVVGPSGVTEFKKVKNKKLYKKGRMTCKIKTLERI
jgi:hypothetical protein